MGLFDIILLIIIGGFGLFGLWFGFFHTLGSLFGTIAGVYLASRYYEPMAGWLMQITGWEGNAPRVIMFIVAFFLINRLVGFVFWIIDRVFSLITRLPFINSINRFSGFVLGLFEGIFTLGIIIYFIERYPLSESLMNQIASSIFAPFLSGVANVMIPLLPDALRLLQSTVDYVQDVVL